MIGCKGEGQQLCCVGRTCIAANETAYEVGINKNQGGNLCVISLYCLELGLKVPTTCCETQHKCLFCQNAAAFPFTGPVPKPVCAILAVQLLPEMGFMKPMPGGFMGSPEAQELER